MSNVRPLKCGATVLTVLVPVVVGMLVSWSGVYVMGLLAVLVVERHLFGLPLRLVLILQDLLAWVPVCLLLGAIAGWVLRKGAVATGLAAAAVALAVLVLTGYDLWRQPSHSTLEQLQVILRLFTLPGLVLIVFLPLGAYAGARLRRA
jgi:hypothetical protein